ncbi:MAG: hypothetical protein HC804_04655 [Anaerolineae bacterium]|nr:hypothetical protein [Anaerolineae bacterium]
MNSYKIAALPGDGIGKEIMPYAMDVMHSVAEKTRAFDLTFESYPWGCEYYLETGEVMPKDGTEILRPYHAIYFVAAGHPAVTDYLSAWEFIFIMRKHFKQYANLRPVRSWEGVPTLLARQDREIDFVIVRENSEGEYAGPGGVAHPDFVNSVAIQTSIFTRHGIERIARRAIAILANVRPTTDNPGEKFQCQADRVCNAAPRCFCHQQQLAPPLPLLHHTID